MFSRRLLRDFVVPILVTVALVAAVTIAIAALNYSFALKHVSIIYLIPVIIAAARLGVVAALIAAIGGLAASAFFFYPPIYDFRIDDPDQLIDLPLFIIVAVVINQLAINLRQQADIARQRENEVQGLYAFSRRLAAAHTAGDIQSAIRDHLSAVIGRRTILCEANLRGESLSGEQTLPRSVQREIAAFADTRKDLHQSALVDAGHRHLWLIRPVSEKTRDFGILAIELGRQSEEAGDVLKQRVDSLLADATATLEHLDLGRAMSEARIRSETEVLRDALIGSVSHQLRTPLVTILGAATVISQAPGNKDNARLQSLSDILRYEVERLNSDVQDLLDATLITSKKVRLNSEWVEPADVVNAAVEKRQQLLAGHRLKLQMPEDLPLIFVDPILLEHALGQIIDNAAKYSRPDSDIGISAQLNGTSIVLSVSDEGIGLVGEERTRLWERFYRGGRHAPNVTGSGLGLWIARAFVTANGGEIEADSKGADRGTVVSIWLPVSENPADDDG